MSNNPDELSAPFTGVLRQLVFSVYAPALLMSMCQGIALLMIPLYALELGANPGIAALIFSLFGLGNVLLDVPAGSVASRLGDKVTMIFGIGIMSLTAIGASLADTPFQLAVCAFFFGAALSTWLIGRLTFISDGVDEAHRGKAIATMAGLQRLGTFIGPVAGGVVATRFGFSVVFLIITCLSFVAVIFVFLFVRRGTAHLVEHDSIPSSVPRIIREHRHVFATAGLAMLMLTIVRASRQLLVPLWGESIGLDTAQIGYIVGAGSAVDMCLFPVAGYVMDNFGRRQVGISCISVLTIGLIAVPFSSSAMTLALAAILIGMGNGLGSGINLTLGADLSPVSNRGEFLGVWRLMADVGSFGGPLLIGFVITAFTLPAAFGVTTIAGITGVGLMFFLVPETRPARTPLP